MTVTYLRTLDERMDGCRKYAYSPEVVPEHALRHNGGAIPHITAADGRRLLFDPANVLFPMPGSLLWVEDHDGDRPVLCIVNVGEAGVYRKYALRYEEAATDG